MSTQGGAHDCVQITRATGAGKSHSISIQVAHGCAGTQCSQMRCCLQAELCTRTLILSTRHCSSMATVVSASTVSQYLWPTKRVAMKTQWRPREKKKRVTRRQERRGKTRKWRRTMWAPRARTTHAIISAIVVWQSHVSGSAKSRLLRARAVSLVLLASNPRRARARFRLLVRTYLVVHGGSRDSGE